MITYGLETKNLKAFKNDLYLDGFCNVIFTTRLGLNGKYPYFEDIGEMWPYLISEENLKPELGAPFPDFNHDLKWNENKRYGLRQKQLLKSIFKDYQIECNEIHPDSTYFKLKFDGNDFIISTGSNVGKKNDINSISEGPDGMWSIQILPSKCKLEKTLEVAKVMEDYLKPRLEKVRELGLIEKARIQLEKKNSITSWFGFGKKK